MYINILKNFWHMWPLTRKCSLRFAVFEQIAIYISPTPWICSTSWKQEILSTSQLAVQKFLNPFDLICSKIFFTRSTSSVQIFIFVSHSSVQKFSSSVHPFHLICLKNFHHLFIYQPLHFKWLSYPFLIHSLAACSFVRNVFAWEVAQFLFWGKIKMRCWTLLLKHFAV